MLKCLLTILLMTACQRHRAESAQPLAEYKAFGQSERVTIRGYNDHAMEPFLSRDGRYLFFNNSNDPKVNTNLHYATRNDDLNFDYKGELKGANSDQLDGVPTMDRAGNFYFVSTRSYFESFATIYRGTFANGAISQLDVVNGLAKRQLGHLNFDVDVSDNGQSLYFVDGIFSGKPVPDTADLVMAVRKGNSFERVPNVFKNINTSALEYAACISADELEFFFTRLTGMKPVIMRATRKNVASPFNAPEHVSAISGFVEAPTLSPDERSLYFHKRESDGLHVLYRVKR